MCTGLTMVDLAMELTPLLPQRVTSTEGHDSGLEYVLPDTGDSGHEVHNLECHVQCAGCWKELECSDA